MQGDTQASRLLADILTTSSHDRRTACPPVRWTPLVERIRAGDEGATRELYSILLKELRLSIWRQLSGRDVNDHIHDIFIVVLRALRGGLLRDTESLIAFIRGVARNHIASYICQAGLHRRRDADGANPQWAAPSPESPEKILLGREKVEIAGQALNRLRPRDREILRRFYVLEQPVTQICQEMRLGATQFRLAKSRAKSLFGEIGRRIMQRRSPGKSAAGAGIAAAGAESNIASE
jgi:RNA polymerase sigma factor (sigma-70 family)